MVSMLESGFSTPLPEAFEGIIPQAVKVGHYWSLLSFLLPQW
jgi:hypothetical protein